MDSSLVRGAALVLACVLCWEAAHCHSNGWLPAHATFYGASKDPATLGGACGYENTYHAGFGPNTAALSSALFAGGAACGGCYQVICDRKQDRKWCKHGRGVAVVVTATNFCPPNNHGGWCDPPRLHLDMSLPAFSRIAKVGSEGIVPVFFRRVPCKRSGGVRFTIKGQANFYLVTITNVGGSGTIEATWVKAGRSRWIPMHRNWGANWQCGVNLHRRSLSFRLKLSEGKILEFSKVVPSTWQSGQTFSSQNQFV